MSDLSELYSSQPSKIVGADANGAETGWVNANATGHLQTTQSLNNGGLEGNITVGTSAVLAKVGASNLASRRILTVMPVSSGKVYFGYTSGVTTSTGTQIFKNQLATFEVTENTDIYLISDTTSQTIKITEGK